MLAKAQLAAAAADPYKSAYVHLTGGPFMVSSTMRAEFGGQTLAIGLLFYGWRSELSRMTLR
jgi:hypothetical protein